MEEIINEFKTFKEGLEAKYNTLSGDITAVSGDLAKLECRINRPIAPGDYTDDPNKAHPDLSKTIGGLVTGQKEFLAAARTSGKARIQLDRPLFSHEVKTLISSSAVGSAVTGVLQQDRIPGIVPLPKRKLRIRDLLRSKPTDKGSVDFVRQVSFTNAAYPQTEGSPKGESAITFVSASAKVATIAHWVPVTRQILDDGDELARFINTVMLYGVKLTEENQLLRGGGINDEIQGLMVGASPYAGTYNQAGDTVVDKIRHAILEMNDQDEYPTGIVISPWDAHNADLIKDLSGGSANTGNYVLSDPMGGSIEFPTMWNLAVVVSRAMPPGKFLVGDFLTGAEIRDRMDATIDISDSHSDFFTSNKLAIRAEERVALPIFRSTAFMAGNL